MLFSLVHGENELLTERTGNSLISNKHDKMFECILNPISKSIGLRLLKFFDFSYIPKALPLGLKPGFNTNCLSPQAHCLNDCFCL